MSSHIVSPVCYGTHFNKVTMSRLSTQQTHTPKMKTNKYPILKVYVCTHPTLLRRHLFTQLCSLILVILMRLTSSTSLSAIIHMIDMKITMTIQDLECQRPLPICRTKSNWGWLIICNNICSRRSNKYFKHLSTIIPPGLLNFLL